MSSCLICRKPGSCSGGRGLKGKEEYLYEYLYSAIYIHRISRSAQAWITQFCLQIHHACLSFVSVYQIAPPLTQVEDIQLQLTTHLSTRRVERLSLPDWLTYSGRFTHISGHPSATGRAQDRESSPAKKRRSTAVPRNQPNVAENVGSTFLVRGVHPRGKTELILTVKMETINIL